MNTTDWLSNWTYPDFPIPENEAARIKRIAELSLEQFQSRKSSRVCELAALITQSSMVAVTIMMISKSFWPISFLNQMTSGDAVSQTMPRHDAFAITLWRVTSILK